MAVCLRTTRGEFLARGRSHWTGPRYLRFALRIRLNHCLRHSAVRISSCVSRTTIIFSPTIRTDEARSQPDFGESPARTFRVDFSFCSRAPFDFPMSDDKSVLPLVAVVGPTASGKSALAVWLAKRLSGEVIACDSTQLYRGFDIGTGKPCRSEREGIPHHLIDALEPEQSATAGGYRHRAMAVLEDLRLRQRLPILTVGTGLYWRALLGGLAAAPQSSREPCAPVCAAATAHRRGYLPRRL